ncbi:MAG: response regulator [Planctomycetota bacterium]|nr:MAG: response regulator [Planctomycetota bacterium]
MPPMFPFDDSPRFLIADDDPICAEVAGETLRPWGEVEIATDGTAAVLAVEHALSAGKWFDVILMDIYMPNMDGLGAIHALRACERRAGSQRMRVLISSVANPNAPMHTQLQDLVDGYFAKPLDSLALLTQLRHWQILPPDEDAHNTTAILRT